jgi:phosphoribosyl 1,2-cyclic phosphodiesterase
MSLFVKFWGTRGSIPTPGPRTERYGGNTPCIEIRADDQIIICDGGTGLRELGLDLLRRCGKQPLTLHLFFSHPHWDHIQGFPFFVPAYLPANTLHVYGASKQDRTIHDLLSGQMESVYFPVNFGELGSRLITNDLDTTAMVGNVRVTAFRQTHPGDSLGFAFEHDGRKIVYSTDHEHDLLLPDPSLAGKHPGELRPIPEEMIEFARDADLLIADGQYTDSEYQKKIGWGHPRATTVVDFAVRAGAKQLALFHHDPMHSDAEVDTIVALCNSRAKALGSKLVVFGAREGIELKL